MSRPMGDGPLVSIGLPVYDGAEFLGRTLESLGRQSYSKIELLISDNASTDATEEICRRHAAADPRIQYSRLAENIGGVPNHNRAFDRSVGKYFMWASHDDLWEPTYVEKCVRLLEEDASAVLAYAKMGIIDATGKLLRLSDEPHTADSPEPAKRFGEFTDPYSMLEAFYGVVRRDVLEKTPRLKRHPGNDRILLAELALHGRFVQVPEMLYLRRDHGQRWVNLFPKIGDRYGWVEPRLAGKRMFPYWGYLAAYTSAALRTQLRFKDRLGCARVLLGFIRDRRRELLKDLL